MTRKLAFLTVLVVVFMALCLLFTACPIQIAPPDADNTLIGSPMFDDPDFSATLTGTARSYGGALTVTLVFEKGWLINFDVAHDDSPEFALARISFVRQSILLSQNFDTFNEPSVVDVISGGSITMSAVLQAFLEAMEDGKPGWEAPSWLPPDWVFSNFTWTR